MDILIPNTFYYSIVIAIIIQQYKLQIKLANIR